MGCCDHVETKFFKVPKGQRFVPGEKVRNDPDRAQHIGKSLLVKTIAIDIVILDGSEFAFGHDQGTFEPPLDVNSLQPLI